jgi:hypothetical protein
MKNVIDSLKNIVFGKTTLRWSGGDPDGDQVSYEVYFGTTTLPPLVATIQDTFFQPGRLNWNTTYYWRIIAKDDKGSVTAGDTWHFKTMDIPTQ